MTTVGIWNTLLGVYYGSVYSLLTSLTISIVGLTKLALAFGVEMIAAGLGFLVAPPIAGKQSNRNSVPLKKKKEKKKSVPP